MAFTLEETEEARLIRQQVRLQELRRLRGQPMPAPLMTPSTLEAPRTVEIPPDARGIPQLIFVSKKSVRCAKCQATLTDADKTAAKCLACGAFYNVPVEQLELPAEPLKCEDCGIVLDNEGVCGLCVNRVDCPICDANRYRPPV